MIGGAAFDVPVFQLKSELKINEKAFVLVCVCVCMFIKNQKICYYSMK